MCGTLCAKIFIANKKCRKNMLYKNSIKKNPADQSPLTASARLR
jgi:hypothetical protein